MGDSAAVRFLKDLRRRRVLRTAGLYVVGVWLLLQAANILFPGWGVPGEAIRYLFWAVLLGFPVALVFGWIFEITPDGIRRTRPVASAAELQESLPLGRNDYLILLAFVIVVGALIYDATGRVLRTASVTDAELRPWQTEIVENSVAVLPFADLSPERDQEYFTDGISEEILNRLSAFRELTVIARTSSFVFKDSSYDIARISGLLGVEYLLQGSVRRDDGQLRVAAQLVDHTGVQVWSQTFDRELGAIFALQDEIAEAVATSIVPRIVPPPGELRLPHFDAYQAYLAGRELVARRSPYWRQNAIEYLDHAIELDPDFAEAYAERAVATAIGTGHLEPRWQRAQEDVDRALGLKPELARGLAAQALLLDLRDREGTHAEREALLRRSLALDPNQVDALNWLSATLEYQGRWEEAEEVLERALRLDPLAPAVNANMAMRKYARGEVTAAERHLLRGLELPHPSHIVYLSLGSMYGRSGRLVEALALQERRILDEVAASGRTVSLPGRMHVVAILGMHERAEYWRKRDRDMFPEETDRRVIALAVLSLETGLLDYAEALRQFRELMTTEVLDLEQGPSEAAAVYGELLALDGRLEAAQAVLQPLLDSDRVDSDLEVRVRLSLGWIHLQAGRRKQAAEQTEPLLRRFREVDAQGRLHVSGGRDAGALSGGLAGYAMATLLAGDAQAALELLERAEAAGWRGYYGALRDPRWDAVRDQPKFKAIMARVKADLDAQRAARSRGLRRPVHSAP
jgi:TolB-like protein/tetratricopeptide (TPR) repeat protein